MIWGLKMPYEIELKFTPLEFETANKLNFAVWQKLLKFTPLEFETGGLMDKIEFQELLKFTPLEFETVLLSILC